MKHVYINCEDIKKWIAKNRTDMVHAFNDFCGEIEVGFDFRIDGYWDELIEEKVRFFDGEVKITEVNTINDLPINAYEKWFVDLCYEFAYDIANENIEEYL